MALATRVKVVYGDVHGNHAAIVFHVAPGIVDPNNAAVQAIVAAINGVINAVDLTIELSQVNAIAGSATSGVAPRMIDKAAMTALDVDGQPHNYRIPGPNSGIFLPDNETVDLTGPDIGTWIGAVTGHAIGPGGATVTSVVKGHRTTNRKVLKR